MNKWTDFYGLPAGFSTGTLTQLLLFQMNGYFTVFGAIHFTFSLCCIPLAIYMFLHRTTREEKIQWIMDRLR